VLLVNLLADLYFANVFKNKKTFGKLKKRKKRKKRDQSLKNVFYIYGQNRPCGLCRVHGVRCELAFRGLHCPVSSRFRAPASGAVHAGNKRAVVACDLQGSLDVLPV